MHVEREQLLQTLSTERQALWATLESAGHRTQVKRLLSLSEAAGNREGWLQGHRQARKQLGFRIERARQEGRSIFHRLRLAQCLLTSLRQVLREAQVSGRLETDPHGMFTQLIALLDRERETYAPRGQLLAHTQQRLLKHFGLSLSVEELDALSVGMNSRPIWGYTRAGNEIRHAQISGQDVYFVMHLADDGRNTLATAYTEEMCCGFQQAPTCRTENGGVEAVRCGGENPDLG